MEEKKPSTADILAKIRAQKAAAAAASPADVSAEVRAVPVPVPESVEPAATPEVIPAAPPVQKPVVAAGAKPASTKDIMAAIRAGGAKPATAVSVASVPAVPVPAAPVSASTVASTPVAGPRPSVQEMLKAVREGKVGAAASAQPAAVKSTVGVAAPPMPARPVVAAKGAKPAPLRRGMAGLATVASISAVCFVLGFATGNSLLITAGALVWASLMTPFMVAWASLGGIGTVWTLGTARFMFPNVLVEPPSKFKVGPLTDYPINTVSNKWKDQFGVWIVHTDQYEGRNMIFALASVCTHLGCTPNWLDGEQKFKCPCHGSGFYMTGVNFEGPAPRPLERVGLRRAEDGMLEVNKSVKFQEEMGQWADPISFVEVV
jgi:cytochrome b6-f complex iron-sulfur subunit